MSLLVTDAGLLTTVQDRGRPGWAHLGVPRAGALDGPAAALANRLVGNPVSAALLEATLGGLRFRAERACLLAVTGAACRVDVGGRPAPWGAAFSVRAGTEVALGPASDGARCYVAVRGGIAVPPVLGSRSTDTLSWVGPPVVTEGTRLPLGDASGDGPADVVMTAAPHRRRELLLHLGPRADWVADPGSLDGATYRVGTDSDRVGLRLDGPVVRRARSGELMSEGIVLGAVQLPPSGLPLVFLHDHPTTGGYPVIAVVDEADLPVCAQARPGEELVLRLR
ncbi:biotin-dependent carboxyltransferase family protein [Nocardioides houyundeii]|uniref:5-oxoprolinase subunit C family protein n=1 Tax=Nocardioides houyundeii TaxID=2045452 RepID=UPI000DF2BD65|nr:biotin-dependent carboxyltransferase family protein [Nocardioides houyundeii]